MIVHALYANDGLIGDIPALMGVSEAEVTRLASAFDLYGETFGHSSNRRRMLPPQWDAEALRAAQARPEPLRSYAHVVVWLYAGIEPDIVMKKFDMPQSELEAVVSAFREHGVAGLEADPLGLLATMPRHRDIGQSDLIPPPVMPQVRPQYPVPVAPMTANPARPVKDVARQYAAPPRAAARPPVVVTFPKISEEKVRALYAGKNARRLEAIREFRQNKDIGMVSRKFGVSTNTLEKWVVEYVRSGMAELDRKSAE